MQEDGCDKGAHQSYHGAEKNTLVNPIVFSLDNAAVVCASLKSISDLEPSSVITESRYLKLGFLGTDLHALDCGGFFKTLN